MNYCSKLRVKMQWIVHMCFTGSVDLKRVEPPLKASPAQEEKSHITGVYWFWGHRTQVRSRRTNHQQGILLEVLQRFCVSVGWNRPEKWAGSDWSLHHDNVPAHPSHLVQQVLVKHGTARLQWPTYLTDLAPCYFSSSQGLRMFSKDTDLRQWKTSHKIRWRQC
jgi:hypothetical protein